MLTQGIGTGIGTLELNENPLFNLINPHFRTFCVGLRVTKVTGLRQMPLWLNRRSECESLVEQPEWPIPNDIWNQRGALE